ncbi:MAG: hypothetical protein M3N54_03720 [Acidobacteriota bacterium]|nr:hypothetical protein [Acidobacteriota bacterium]
MAAPPVYRPVNQAVPRTPYRTIQRASERSPTMSTYMQTRVTSELPLSAQGPHTVSHAIVSYGIESKVSGDSWQELDDLFGQQVPDPSDVQRILVSEISETNKARFSGQLKRYVHDYEILYGMVEAGLEEENDANFQAVLGAVRQLMEMHPYQTYGWKSGKKVSKKSIKGKSEATHKKNFIGGDKSALKGLIDVSRAKFAEDAEFLKFVKTRLLLVTTEGEIDELFK